jgi:hypothetical protein
MLARKEHTKLKQLLGAPKRIGSWPTNILLVLKGRDKDSEWPFQPGLMFATNAKAYLLGAQLTISTNIILDWKGLSETLLWQAFLAQSNDYEFL